jgi:hypothetical protein
MFPRNHSIRRAETPTLSCSSRIRTPATTLERHSRAVEFFHNAGFVLAALGLAGAFLLYFAVW